MRNDIFKHHDEMERKALCLFIISIIVKFDLDDLRAILHGFYNEGVVDEDDMMEFVEGLPTEEESVQ